MGGCPGPGLGGGFQAQAQGGFQAQTQRGSVQAQTQRGGVQAQARGGGVCFPVCTEADIPQQTANAADGTHPTGMNFCFYRKFHS